MKSAIHTYAAVIFIMMLILLGLPPAAIAQTPLTCGQPATGVINTPTQDDYYTFDANTRGSDLESKSPSSPPNSA